MNITVLKGTKEALADMKGQAFVPLAGEGVVFLKLVFLKPETVESGDPAKTVEEAEGVILCGDLNEIREQVSKWFGESATQYSGS